MTAVAFILNILVDSITHDINVNYILFWLLQTVYILMFVLHSNALFFGNVHNSGVIGNV